MENSIFIILSFIYINFALVVLFHKIKIFNFNIDVPDKIRKFHSKPTPLAGGQIIFFNLIIYCIILKFQNNLLEKEVFFQSQSSLNYFMMIATLIFILGFVDDKLNLRPNLKFLILIIIIFLQLYLDNNLILDKIKFSFLKDEFFLKNFKLIFSIFCFVVFLNALNMFDGINLQSSIYSLLIFSCIIFFYIFSLIVSILIISMIAFSYLNYKNKNFLGDSGSLLLGYLISYFFISLYNQNYIIYADQVVLYMIIPGLELIRLFIIRILEKKNPLNSDRNHLHHLLLSKYSLEKTLIILIFLLCYPIMLSLFDINNIITIISTSLIYFTLVVFIKKKIIH